MDSVAICLHEESGVQTLNRVTDVLIRDNKLAVVFISELTNQPVRIEYPLAKVKYFHSFKDS